jgi:integrase
MARPATGSVREKQTAKGTVFAIRFPVPGLPRQYERLGGSWEGWNRERAETRLQDTMALVRMGKWQPPEADPEPEAPKVAPDFRTFASQWYAAASPEWGERTRTDYKWRLAHLPEHFARHRLDRITVEDVDRFRQMKVRESTAVAAARERELAKPPEERVHPLPRPLSNGSINKMIRLLSVVLDQAQEYGYLSTNPAKGKKRLLREPKPSRGYLQPDQVAALLRAAGELDAEAREGDTGRRKPILATLTLAGLRISELLDLRWRHLNLARRELRVPGSKTDAAARTVDLTPTLSECLTESRSRARFTDADDYVFATSTGRRDGASNIRRRFLAAAVERANESLEDDEPIAGATPHGLRRTFISLLLHAGADVPYVMAQAGHTDPAVTLGIYAKVIASKTDHGAALDGLVEGAELPQAGDSFRHRIGTGRTSDVPAEDPARSPDDENPRDSRGSRRAADGIRTHDLLHGKQTL